MQSNNVDNQSQELTGPGRIDDEALKGKMLENVQDKNVLRTANTLSNKFFLDTKEKKLFGHNERIRLEEIIPLIMLKTYWESIRSFFTRHHLLFLIRKTDKNRKTKLPLLEDKKNK